MLDPYVKLLKNGDLVAFPTETVYGLGADALNPEAIQKVFKQKGRPSDNPLIVHISSFSMLKEFTDQITPDAKKLMNHFWPGPLTLIFPKKTEVLDVITAGLQTVAVRWPHHPLSQQLIAEAGPLVAPSANTSGKPSPTKPAHIKEDFGEDFPIIEGGETNVGLESTVLDISQTPYTIYRPGAVSAEEIQQLLKKEVLVASPSDSNSGKSPGTKYTHYAPKAQVRWLSPGEEPDSTNTLYLLHSQPAASGKENIIGFGKDYLRFARELYDRFRQADHEEYASVVIEPFPTEYHSKLIPALQNRIQKAVSS